MKTLTDRCATDFEESGNSDGSERIFNIGNVASIDIGVNLAKPDNSASEVIGDIQAFVPLEGIIDPNAEKERQEKHLAQLKYLAPLTKQKQH